MVERYKVLSMEEYQELSRMKEEITDNGRAFATEPGNPFLVEPFCAQVAWMSKACPVYPFTATSPKDICRFLIDEGYEDYRCPVCASVDVIYKPIFERGSEEERKALENLADMSVRYCVDTPYEFKIEVSISGEYPFSNAIRIYEGLGLDEKAKKATRLFHEKYNGVAFTPKEIEEARERREELKKRQARIDEESKKKWEEFFGGAQ